MSAPVPAHGLFASLQRLLATVFEIAQVRLDLLGTEFELEKRRLFAGLLWAALALLMLMIGLVLLCGFVILLFGEGYRLTAIGAMALLFLGAGVLLLLAARHRLYNRTHLFNTSVAELQRDRAGLQSSARDEAR